MIKMHKNIYRISKHKRRACRGRCRPSETGCSGTTKHIGLLHRRGTESWRHLGRCIAFGAKRKSATGCWTKCWGWITRRLAAELKYIGSWLAGSLETSKGRRWGWRCRAYEEEMNGLVNVKDNFLNWIQWELAKTKVIAQSLAY